MHDITELASGQITRAHELRDPTGAGRQPANRSDRMARPGNNLHTSSAASCRRESDEHFGACSDRAGPDPKGAETVNGVQRVADDDIWPLVKRIRSTRGDRQTYIRDVLQDFGFLVADKAGNPASLVDGPEDDGFWSEADIWFENGRAVLPPSSTSYSNPPIRSCRDDPPPPNARPGYYPDAQGVMRWWDGRQWTNQVSPPPNQPERQPDWRAGQKKDRKILAIVLGSILGLVLFASCIASLGSTDSSDSTDDATVEAEPTPIHSAAKTSKPDKPAGDTVKDGEYLVGREIKTGTWKAANPPEDELCYADTENKKGDILEQEISSDGQSVIIRIKPNAYTFTSKDCGTWHRVD